MVFTLEYFENQQFASPGVSVTTSKRCHDPDSQHAAYIAILKINWAFSN